MTNIDYGKELQNAYDEGYAKAKSEIKSIWHDTSNYDDRPKFPDGEREVACLIDFGKRQEVASYILDKGDDLWVCDRYFYDFDTPNRWAYLSDIVKL